MEGRPVFWFTPFGPPNSQFLLSRGQAMTSVQDNAAGELLRGRRIGLVGKMAGMPKRELVQLIRSQGGIVAEHLDASLDLVVVGEEELPAAAGLIEESFDAEMRQSIERRTLEII